ncbi:hypothetical protein K0M31_018347 [Melipona bicolor]|uniref:Uncharacterized protein n=1 Tax=Melipona bicolor TaxID=60889 RepID=A0AA40KRU5_9HYME|nr:hypothetical protein K0M31_018347 [Melipona bicolor]
MEEFDAGLCFWDRRCLSRECKRLELIARSLESDLNFLSERGNDVMDIYRITSLMELLTLEQGEEFGRNLSWNLVRLGLKASLDWECRKLEDDSNYLL